MSTQLYHKNFNLLVIGQIISLFGSSIQRFALSLYLLDLTGSASIFASILAISMIPVVLVSPVDKLLKSSITQSSQWPQSKLDRFHLIK